MEEHKKRAYSHFLRKSKRSNEDYTEPSRTISAELKDSYLELAEQWQQKTDEFLQLWVIDGSFLIKILIMQFNGYVLSDPFFCLQRLETSATEKIKRDMLLMENQPPLPVLQKLLDVFKEATGHVIDTKRLVLDFFFPGKGTTCGDDCKHILDMVYLSMTGTIDPTTRVPSVTGNRDQEGMQIPQSSENEFIRTVINNRSAMVVKKGGVKFKLNPAHNINEISFCIGKLNFPGIVIENNSESTFMNLIALDQLRSKVSHLINSYFLFLNNLITSADDIKLLRDQEIIKSSIACDVIVHKIFMRLGDGLVFGISDDLGLMREELNR